MIQIAGGYVPLFCVMMLVMSLTSMCQNPAPSRSRILSRVQNTTLPVYVSCPQVMVRVSPSAGSFSIENFTPDRVLGRGGGCFGIRSGRLMSLSGVVVGVFMATLNSHRPVGLHVVGVSDNQYRLGDSG